MDWPLHRASALCDCYQGLFFLIAQIFFCCDFFSRELLSGRALRITPNPGQDAAEFKNGELLLRAWLNDHFPTVSEYSTFSFGSDRITFLTGGSLANLDGRPVPYAVTHSPTSESR